MLERIHAAAGPLGRTHDKDPWERAEPRLEQRMVTVQVAADDVGAGSPGAVTHDRQLCPRRRVEQAHDGYGRRVFGATD